MKTNIQKISVVLLLCVAAMAASTIETKAQGKTTIGGQLAFGTKDLNLGFGARGEFSITDNISIVPKFTYYLGKSEGGVSLTAWALDGDAHYYFTTDGLNFYGLAGLAYSNMTVSIPSFQGFGGGSSSDGKLGLNLGAGANFASVSDSIIPFAEVRYNTAFEALLISAGVSFPIGK